MRTGGTSSPATTVMDGVPFVVTGSTCTGFPTNLQALQSAGAWLPSRCGGAPCSYGSTPPGTDPSVAVNWTGMTQVTSMQRKPVPDTNTVSDWHGALSSFGWANPWFGFRECIPVDAGGGRVPTGATRDQHVRTSAGHSHRNNFVGNHPGDARSARPAARRTPYWGTRPIPPSAARA